jgi:hypothetical protein
MELLSSWPKATSPLVRRPAWLKATSPMFGALGQAADHAPSRHDAARWRTGRSMDAPACSYRLQIPSPFQPCCRALEIPLPGVFYRERCRKSRVLAGALNGISTTFAGPRRSAPKPSKSPDIARFAPYLKISWYNARVQTGRKPSISIART